MIQSNSSAKDVKQFIDLYLKIAGQGDSDHGNDLWNIWDDKYTKQFVLGLTNDVQIDTDLFVGKREDGTEYNLTDKSQISKVFGIEFGNGQCAIHHILTALENGKITTKEAYIATAMCYKNIDGTIDADKLAEDFNSMRKLLGLVNIQKYNAERLFEILSYPLENE